MKKVALAVVLVWLFLMALCAVAQAGSKTLTFEWNQEMSTGFAGWKLYKATAPNVAVSAANLFATIPYGGTPSTAYTSSQTLTSPDGQTVTYYFVLTAFDTAGNESAKSNEVNAPIDFQAPGSPNTLKVTVTAAP